MKLQTVKPLQPAPEILDAIQNVFMQVQKQLATANSGILVKYLNEQGINITDADKYIEHIVISTGELPPYILQSGRFVEKHEPQIKNPKVILKYRVYNKPVNESGTESIQVGFQVAVGDEEFESIKINETETI